jgi:hypothetical protein
MTPREALIHLMTQLPVGALAPRTAEDNRALLTLERLVAKDEADAKYRRPAAHDDLGRRACTCGTTTPCKVWGHS